MLEILIVFLCIGLNAVFAAVEIAFVTTSQSRLRKMAEQGVPEAERAFRLREFPERTLSVLQIGITLVGAVSAAVGGVGARSSIGPWLERQFGFADWAAEAAAILCVVAPLTYLNVVFGELVPKALALRRPARIVLLAARWLEWADRAASPAVTALEASTSAILRCGFPRRRDVLNEKASGPVKGEARRGDDVDAAHGENGPGQGPGQGAESRPPLDRLSDQAKQYVFNLASAERKRTGEVCVPWAETVSVRLDQDLKAVESAVVQSRHTRLPVARDPGPGEQGPQIAGLLNSKEFIAFRASGESQWGAVVRPMVAVDENAPLLSALRSMQDRRSHMAAVQSGTRLLGIVTMEDILEEIIGDVYDEDDDGALKRLLAVNARTRRLGSSTFAAN